MQFEWYRGYSQMISVSKKFLWDGFFLSRKKEENGNVKHDRFGV